MGLLFKSGELINKVVVFYNKNTTNIITILKPNNTSLDIDSFVYSRLKYDYNCKGLEYSDIDFIIVDSDEYDFYSNNCDANVHFSVDPIKKKFNIDILKLEQKTNKNLVYGTQKYKREFTMEQVNEMYNEDYINFNLKNAILYGGMKAEFIPIKDLNIRPHITKKTWKYFVSDPYLAESSDDKLKLGRSILKMGTWWPFLVSPVDSTSDRLYVCEGNHRIISLKLLAMYGEITDNYKVFCIHIPSNYEAYKNEKMFDKLKNPVIIRCILENVYGCEVIHNNDILQKVLQKIKDNGDKLINPYTIETEVTIMKDLMFGLHSYPLFLRDLFYIFNNSIKPSKIINNEETFKRWLNS